MAEELEKKEEEVKEELEEKKEEPEEKEVELDEDGNPVEKKEEEPWQAVEKEGGDLDDVPALTHIKIKQKLKGRITDRDDEIRRLKEENEQLKAKPEPIDTKPLKRPDEDDFDTTEEYHAALDDYDTKMATQRYDLLDQQRNQSAAQTQAKDRLDKSVTEHYERAGKLLESSGISSEVYKKADQTVREAIEAVMPGMGDAVTDQMISRIGKGSAEVMYYLGRNRGALNEVKSLLLEDNSGISVAIYLGEQKARLTTPKRQRSQAQPPVDEVIGDAVLPGNERKFKKQYDAAHNKGDIQAAYNAKKAAKTAGVDVKSW